MTKLTIEQRENMMDMVITAKYNNNVEITGKVVDYSVNGEYIHIENDEDYFMIDLTKVTLSVNKEEKVEITDNHELFAKFVEENGYSYAGGGIMEDNGSVDVLNGFTYKVSVFIPNNENNEDFYLETYHKGRMENSSDSDDYTANRQYRKTWKGFKNLLSKYLEA